jgi:CelD/BcsL family acetyltransferase involved in cellulose biosynthesis
MAQLQLKIFDSIDQLASIVPQWDALWEADANDDPVNRPASLSLWFDHRGTGRQLRVLTVWDSQEMVGCLPLVAGAGTTGPLVGHLPQDCWLAAGDLLIDPMADTRKVADELIDAIQLCPWPLYRFEYIRTDQPSWATMIEQLKKRRFGVELIDRWKEGLVDLSGSFESILASRSRNFHKTYKRRHRRLAEFEKPIQFRFIAPEDDSRLETLLRRIFELERQSWKGDAGTSVLQGPGIFEYYLDLSQLLARWGLLRIGILETDDELVAFDWGWVGQRTYYSIKVSYNNDYRALGPGHLLMEAIVRQLCDDPEINLYAFYGEQNEALSSWSTDEYWTRRLTLARPTGGGRVGWLAYTAAAKTVRAVRGWKEKTHP